MTPQVPVPRPSYSQARESLVKAIPPRIICLLACGGRDCRYEGPDCWRPGQQAIQGLFSSWVTHDIVAMARPSTYLIDRYNIIQQFKQLNIKSIINMQLPGEHAHCGPPLDPDSGFTYSPQIFMENQIFFYNYGMADFGVSSLEGILDAVKVLAFSVQEGRVAVHCHAGLGRTGVVIACYLIYTLRVSASEAVHYVRIRRPRSIQTRAQISLVFDFARLLGSQLTQFPSLSLRHGAAFTLHQYLHRQSLLLHGPEARSLKYTPKIVHFLCSQLSALALGVASPPHAQVELDRRTALLALQRTVRDTLSLKTFLPILRDVRRPRGRASLSSSVGSLTSWDEPFGFLMRKREVLLNKHSYSESDLSKIATNEETVFTQHPALLRDGVGFCNGTARQSHDQAWAPVVQLKDQCNGRTEGRSPIHVTKNDSATKRTKCRAKEPQGFPKFRSNSELHRTQNKPRQASVSKAIARAMAQQAPPNDRVLYRAAYLQDELNEQECGWATLAMETDPKVLSYLLWAWLEKLKEPVLNCEDVMKLTPASGDNRDKLQLLHKVHTIYCVLRCVAILTAQCPQLEEPLLQRLIRALTKRPPEEIGRYASLLELLRDATHHLQT
ncbi:protein tyrosine phosphatase domain-containing protein 1 [Chanos chanos]|uniref:Protein tyrosine phosphatase domain-containing protein 1 n=1 Tax=Chanos chanos TaxID=29144 RepID=A0A6J2WL92_CHACN|nr:protein tyrosine phosphatase domain-containing protein 1-like [Chanos chanos]